MLIMDPDNNTITLEDVTTPLATDHFWVLDLVIKDYTLAPLTVLEMITSKSVEVMINGFRFILPGKWNMLVVDEDTSLLDYIEIGKLGGKDFTALIHGPRKNMIEHATVVTTDYHPRYVNIAPSLSKSQMLCHPIAPDAWVNVAPSDTYNKYLKNCVAGDII